MAAKQKTLQEIYSPLLGGNLKLSQCDILSYDLGSEAACHKAHFILMDDGKHYEIFDARGTRIRIVTQEAARVKAALKEAGLLK